MNQTREDRAKQMTYLLDELTGMPRRPAFIESAKELIAGNPSVRYCFVLGNVNRLKVINDLYSFQIGNDVITAVATAIQMAMTNMGVAGCFGSGLFAMCFPYSQENMEAITQNIVFDCKELGINQIISMRMGAVISSGDPDEINMELNQASYAMDKVSNRTRNECLFFSESMHEELLREAKVTAEMRQAMEQGEFVAYLQPQYSHINKKLIGAEVLCRWKKEDGRLISPGIFIPVFEKNGYVRELDKHMWKLSFQLVKKWTDEGVPHVPLSVNISRMSLIDDEFIDSIRELKQTYEIDPKDIHFEVTESAYMESPDELIERVNCIRDLGFDIAMDDFGSGYSSLNTLKDVPIDILKLDMGFLRGNTNMERGGNIISNIIRMAHSLRLITIAEGVEKLSQADFLTSVGCDIIQGYLYSKPVPVEEFEIKMRESAASIKETLYSINKDTKEELLFNPNSEESRIFNRFIGPSAFIDYSDRTVFFIRVNEKFTQLLADPDSTYLKFTETFFHHVKETGDKLIHQTIQKAIATGMEEQCILEYCHITRGMIWLKLHFSLIHINGTHHILLLQAEDVTEEKRSGVESTKAIEQFLEAMETAPTGVLLLEANVIPGLVGKKMSMKVLRANDVFAQGIGYSKEELSFWTEKELLATVYPLDWPIFLIKMRKCMDSHFSQFTSHSYRFRGKDGKLNAVNLSVVGMEKSENNYWLLIHFTPVTKNDKSQKKDEEQDV